VNEDFSGISGSKYFSGRVIQIEIFSDKMILHSENTAYKEIS
jgi:hypothetical protein